MDRTIQARITPALFQEFAWFDTLRQQKRYRAPLTFALIMAAFAAMCFVMRRVKHAVLLGSVLLGIGLILPLGWLLSFHLSVRAEVKRLKLAQAPVAYTLRLTGKGLTASAGQEKYDYTWEQLYRVCRLRRCICLYVNPRRAFLLPTEAGQEGDALWQSVCRQMPDEKIQDHR